MLRARASLRLELAALEKRVRQLGKDDPVCLRLMTIPGIGSAMTMSFRSSTRVSPCVGLTPSRNQSGGRYISGGIILATLMPSSVAEADLDGLNPHMCRTRRLMNR